MTLPELPLTPTGETAQMWTIVLQCDECSVLADGFPEVRAVDKDAAYKRTRHEAAQRGWLPIDSFGAQLDLCPACAVKYEESKR